MGSWYVETLDQVLEENAATDDLVTMLMMVRHSDRVAAVEAASTASSHLCPQVNHQVSQNSAKGLYKQMPGSFNFLRKLLYFQSQGPRQTPS